MALKKSKKLAKSKSAKKPVSSSKKTAAAPFQSTGFWLMKSEPDAYSIDQFKKDGKTLWTGVRNYQARNFMMTSMVPGDQVIFYHSNAEPSAAVGIGKITKINVPDPSALDPDSEYFDPKASTDHPIWFCAEVAYVGHLKTPISLGDLRNQKELKDMLLLKPGQRLSILPLTNREFEKVIEISGGLK